MGLTAHLYKSRLSADNISLSQIMGDKKIDDLEEIAYFRNNWEFHRFIDKEGFYLTPLCVETLKRAKERAEYDENFNKDYGEGQSVLSVIDDAITYIECGGYTIFYTSSF